MKSLKIIPLIVVLPILSGCGLLFPKKSPNDDAIGKRLSDEIGNSIGNGLIPKRPIVSGGRTINDLPQEYTRLDIFTRDEDVQVELNTSSGETAIGFEGIAQNDQKFSDYVQHSYRKLDDTGYLIEVGSPKLECVQYHFNEELRGVDGVCVKKIKIAYPNKLKTRVYLNGVPVESGTPVSDDDLLNTINRIAQIRPRFDMRARALNAYLQRMELARKFSVSEIGKLFNRLPSKDASDEFKLELLTQIKDRVTDPKNVVSIAHLIKSSLHHRSKLVEILDPSAHFPIYKSSEKLPAAQLIAPIVGTEVPNPSLPKTLELIKKSSPLGWGISGERISLSFEKDRIVTASADLISVLNLSGTILRQFKIPRELRGVFSVHLVGLETIAVILVNDVYFLKDSGALISKYSLPAPLGGQPISKDRLLVWTKDKAINFNSQGEAQFEYDCSGGCIEINRPSLTGEGQIALPVQGRVDLLDASSGQWTKSIFGSGSSAAQVHPDGGLVFACIDQKYGLCRLSPKASESWQVNREGDRRVNWFKVLADGNIAVRFEGDQGFQILDAHTGAARYSVPISAPFEFKGALSNGVIVIEDSVYRGLRFFDGLSGSELARTKEASFLFPLPDNTFVLALAEGSFDSVLGWFRLK